MKTIKDCPADATEAKLQESVLAASSLMQGLLEGLKKGNHEALADANADFLLRREMDLAFYGEFLLNVTFHEAPNMGTVGVNATNSGFNFYWDRNFVEGKTKKELYFLLLHEVFHLILCHPGRAKAVVDDMTVANIAMDMIINSTLRDNFKGIDCLKEGFYLPPECPCEPIFESVYAWLKEVQQKLPKEPQQGQGKGDPQDGQGQQGQGDPQDGAGDQQGQGSGAAGKDEKDEKGSGKGNGKDQNGKSDDMKKAEDTLRRAKEGKELEQELAGKIGKHLKDEVAEEIRKAFGDRIIEGLKNRGLGTASVDSVLEKLRKTKKDYLRQFRNLFTALKGTVKYKTFSHPSRRGVFGIKGYKKHGCKITLMLDVSGSMYGQFERALGPVFQDGLDINVILCDTEIKGHTVIKSKADFKKLKISGGGGTELQPGINYIVEKLPGTNVVVITDGICDSLDVSGIKGKVLILTVDKEVEIVAGAEKVKQLVIEKDAV